MISKYGFEFVCGYRKGNTTGYQFHPEKAIRLESIYLNNIFMETDFIPELFLFFY